MTVTYYLRIIYIFLTLILSQTKTTGYITLHTNYLTCKTCKNTKIPQKSKPNSRNTIKYINK